LAYHIHILDRDQAYLDGLPLSPEAKERINRLVEEFIADVPDEFRLDPENRPDAASPFFLVQHIILDRWGDGRMHRPTSTSGTTRQHSVSCSSSSSITTKDASRGLRRGISLAGSASAEEEVSENVSKCGSAPAQLAKDMRILKARAGARSHLATVPRTALAITR
jgi:hypothetical protein